MKSMMPLFRLLLADAGSIVGVSTDRSYKTAAKRVEHEGELEFLALTLPRFGKDLERGLSLGSTDGLFVGFSRRQPGIPKFLGEFLQFVFDPITGSLREGSDVQTDAILCVRQVTLAFAKVRQDFTDAQLRVAADSYIEVERTVRSTNVRVFDDPKTLSKLDSVFQRVWGEALRSLDLAVFNNEIYPKHGPGMTADRTLGNAKWRRKVWTDRLESVFLHQDYLLPSLRYSSEFGCATVLPSGDEPPAKVTFVPKTLGTPRTIAMEPTHMMYMQQGLMSVLVGSMNSSPFVDLTDQSPNRHLARLGSIDGQLATLDLSSASDCVSNRLVCHLLRDYAWAQKAVSATRSNRADVPGYGVIPLAKFASMGSALCFPVETMVFVAIAILGCLEDDPSADLNSLVGSVRSFGDDIIVPSRSAPSVIRYLEHFGFSVNRNKSFWTGLFRESCGGDYYAGENVGIFRFRAVVPTSRSSVEDVLSTVATRNLAYLAGFWRTARWLDVRLESILGHFPIVDESSTLVGRTSFLKADHLEGDRICRDLQTNLRKGWFVQAKPPVNEIDGPDALLKWFSVKGVEPLAADHLVRSGRPQRLDIKLGWKQPV